MRLLEETPLHESSGLTKSPGDGAKLGREGQYQILRKPNGNKH
jgi:hypothetical protein